MDRVFIEASVDELEQILSRHKQDRVVLAQLREELGFRRSKRAIQLRKEVLGVLSGIVPVEPRPPRASRPEDQIDLLTKKPS